MEIPLFCEDSRGGQPRQIKGSEDLVHQELYIRSQSTLLFRWVPQSLSILLDVLLFVSIHSRISFLCAVNMTIDSREPSVVGKHLIIWSAIFGVFAISSTVIRIIVRGSRRTFGHDDSFIIAALLCTIVRYSVNIHAVRSGYGQHQRTLEAKQYEYTNFLSWLGQIFLFSSLCLLKISIGLLIMRIKDTRKMRIFQWTLIAGLVASTIEVLVVLLSECQPTRAWWEKGAGKCWPNKIRIYSIYIQAGYGILTDMIYSLMPVFIVWKLHMPWQKKASICGLMCVGLM